MPSAHCMRCGHGVTPINVRRVTLKNGRTAERGECPACHTETNKLVKKGT